MKSKYFRIIRGWVVLALLVSIMAAGRVVRDAVYTLMQCNAPRDMAELARDRAYLANYGWYVVRATLYRTLRNGDIEVFEWMMSVQDGSFNVQKAVSHVLMERVLEVQKAYGGCSPDQAKRIARANRLWG